jgi:hypothetical protein
MIAFSKTTAFRLVRRLAMGHGTTGMYLLIHDEGEQVAIETDLRAEVEVQLAGPLPVGRVSELFDVDDALGLSEGGRYGSFGLTVGCQSLWPYWILTSSASNVLVRSFCFSQLRPLLSNCSWRRRTSATVLLRSSELSRTILREAIRIEFG